ncbi:MAG TPA: cysteine hydrolase family protein [Phycisphaerae bacterium]|nr:cysteine hydrolase family protein [Phycisphaerae bacterium]HOJ75104.1 cysteine hydrolase family protein [Phycisphaerae bacterium]HOM53489.1 cysteine hydrolase family protein [Phycisphaerae bacterium]HON68229.1 cysteine hydrolase family protein [Phycisphaerae bacterium]HOQ86519.1 cysteine hydrolase family protein [Phycisphaerae bacterium]
MSQGAASWNRVLIDICTQRDFLDPGAILQVANRDAIVPRLEQIFAWARRVRFGMFSSVESHRPAEPPAGFPLHCIDGTPGQEKLPFTYLHPSILVEVDNTLALPPNLREKYHQLIFRKRTRDVLSNPKADRFLTQLDAEEFIIFGVGLEQAIRVLALGLLARHKTVTVVADACGFWSSADADLALRQLGAKAIRIISTEELTAPPAPPVPRTLLRRPILSGRSGRSHSPADRPARPRRKRSDVTKG